MYGYPTDMKSTDPHYDDIPTDRYQNFRDASVIIKSIISYKLIKRKSMHTEISKNNFEIFFTLNCFY